MRFNGFTRSDFESFQIEGLEARMQAIRERIQPKFRALAGEIQSDASVLTGNELFLHVARHARRKVNPPADTWMALCHNKKGYKQHPHFQVGLYDDRLFIWFALIYEAPNKQEIAERLLRHRSKLYKSIPKDYFLSVDHMKKDSDSMHAITLKQFTASLERFRDVKSAELLVGRVHMMNDPIIGDGLAFIRLVRDTIEQLTPMYAIAMNMKSAK
jgi:uncharacterized protein YktB (UPF0637 family)